MFIDLLMCHYFVHMCYLCYGSFRFFDPGDSPLSNADNPSATILSTMPHYRDHSAEMAYSSGTGYFWATKVDTGDSLLVVFDVAQNLSRIVVKTGNTEHPTDFLHSGRVYVSQAVTKVSERIVTCDSGKSVASFQNGVAIADQLESVLSFHVRCLQVTVEEHHDHWVLFANVAVFVNR